MQGHHQRRGSPASEMLFHGTTWDKAQDFALNGFVIPALRPGRRRLAGANLYFERNPFTAMAYSSAAPLSAHAMYTLILAEVAVGQTRIHAYPPHEDILYNRVRLRPARIVDPYDSLAIRTATRDEVVVPSADQARPLFILRFRWLA